MSLPWSALHKAEITWGWDYSRAKTDSLNHCQSTVLTYSRDPQEELGAVLVETTVWIGTLAWTLWLHQRAGMGRAVSSPCFFYLLLDHLEQVTQPLSPYLLSKYTMTFAQATHLQGRL